MVENGLPVLIINTTPFHFMWNMLACFPCPCSHFVANRGLLSVGVLQMTQSAGRLVVMGRSRLLAKNASWITGFIKVRSRRLARNAHWNPDQSQRITRFTRARSRQLAGILWNLRCDQRVTRFVKGRTWRLAGVFLNLLRDPSKFCSDPT